MVRIRFLRLFLLVPSLMMLVGLSFGRSSPEIAFALMLAAFGLFVLFIALIVCPQCQKSPHVCVRIGEDGVEKIEYSAPWGEATCSRCGHRFVEPDE